MRVPLLVLGLLSLATGGTLAVIFTGRYFALEDQRLPRSRWSWFDTNPENFKPEVRGVVLGLRRLVIVTGAITVLGVVVLWVAFS